MRNITVSVDDETYRRARIAAAEQQTSVSALVKGYLQSLTNKDSAFDHLRQLEAEARKQIKYFSVSENIHRDELYRRDKG